MNSTRCIRGPRPDPRRQTAGKKSKEENIGKQSKKINGQTGKPAQFDVVEMYGHPGRFEIVDTETGEIIDNANGYGYKSKPNAYKAGR